MGRKILLRPKCLKYVRKKTQESRYTDVWRMEHALGWGVSCATAGIPHSSKNDIGGYFIIRNRSRSSDGILKIPFATFIHAWELFT